MKHSPRLTFRALALGATYLLSGALASTAHASSELIMNFTFEDGVLPTAWGVGGSGTGAKENYLSVVNDPSREGNKVLKIDDTANANMVRAQVGWTPALSANQYELKMQVYIANSGGAGSDYTFARRISLFGTDTSSYTRIVANPAANSGTGAISTSGYSGPIGNGGAFVSGSTMNFNTWYEVSQVVDITNQTWTYSYKNVATGDTIYTSPELNFAAASTDLYMLFFNEIGTADKGGLVYFDNVSLQAIPEPGSVGLMVGSSILLLGGFRRFFRRA